MINNKNLLLCLCFLVFTQTATTASGIQCYNCNFVQNKGESCSCRKYPEQNCDPTENGPNWTSFPTGNTTSWRADSHASKVNENEVCFIVVLINDDNSTSVKRYGGPAPDKDKPIDMEECFLTNIRQGLQSCYCTIDWCNSSPVDFPDFTGAAGKGNKINVYIRDLLSFWYIICLEIILTLHLMTLP